MKKLTYLLFLAMGVTACSVESIDSTENLLTADARFKAANTTEMVFENRVCAGEETTITVNFPQRTNNHGNLLPTNVKVELKVAGEWIEIYGVNHNGVTTASFIYTFNEEKEYELRYSAETGGWNPSQYLNVEDCSDCEESFSYVKNDNGTYTFTYIPAEDMTDANVVFTFAQGYVSGLESWTENGQTMQKSMNFEACQTYNWIVILDTRCNGEGQGGANVWTDFKVEDDSKKNDETPNIKKNC